MRVHRRGRQAAVAVTALAAAVLSVSPVNAAPNPPAWTVEPVQGGHRLTLKLDAPLPVRDAVPELAVDGRSLGPAQESPDGRTLTIVTAAPEAADPSSVKVAWNGEVPSATAPKSAKAAPAPAPSARGGELPVDPADPGPYSVKVTGYDLGDTAMEPSGLGGRKAEVRAEAYLPDKRGKGPLVLFLHGRHSACYDPVAWTTSNSQWPCPDGQKPIDSYKGYQEPAKVLASHGYTVVSISANGVNAADNPYSDDRGALARGELVMRHLDLLAQGTKGKGPLGAIFDNRLDMNDIGLMGHSRGGEGVVKAALLNDGRDHPYGIKAVLPLAPTDFARATLPNIPMGVLLPYCDGDVSNQQGQHFYDDTLYADAGDRAFRAAQLVMGADHNFFNTEWTPGTAHFPAGDDWSNNADPVCGNTAPTRLSAAEQYKVGTAYIAGFFRLVQGGEDAFLPLFDGSGGTAASAGRAVVHTVAQAPAKERSDVAAFTSLPGSVTVGGAATGVICASMLDRSIQSGLPSCATRLTTSQAPSWTPATYAPNVPATPVLHFTWTDPTGYVAAAVPARAANVKRYDALTFRAALDESTTAADLTVTVVDDKGYSKSVRLSDVSDALTPFPGTVSPLPKTWLRTVRIPVSALKGLKLSSVASVRLSAASGTGSVYLADLAFTGADTGRADASALPQVSVRDLTVPEGDGPGTATMTLALSRKSTVPVTVNVQSIASGAAPVIAQVARQVVVPAGATAASFEVPLAGDTIAATVAQSYQVVASAPENAEIGDGFARLVVTDDDAA
ncbi:poly(ethylene terephthalate) hydrolase family protein [Actinomadura napierensis]|uniref:poly(ethylene terephthalate) hydrolase n=1 Tax=Actinomadura napierensis TaxID=267854 RepID=A0ABP5LW35_9ACTN